MKKFFSILLIALLLNLFSPAVFSANEAPAKGGQTITGILTEITQSSIGIRTQDGKELSYMRGFKLKIPEKAAKGSLVTIRINPILNVVKSIELGTGKHAHAA